MTVRSLPSALLIALSFIMVPCVAVIGLQVYQVRAHTPQLTQSRELVVQAFEVISTAQGLNQAVRDAERGLRRFVLSGERTYLESYEVAVTNSRASLAKLKELAAGNPENLRRLPNLEHQIDLELSELQRMLQSSERNGFSAVQEILRASATLDALPAISGIIDATIAAERAGLAERLSRMVEEERNTAATAIASALFAFATMVLGVYLAIVTFRSAQRMEGARRAGEQRFGLLVEGVADHALYLLDANGCITDWNSGAERLKGYNADEIVGLHFSHFYGEEDRRARIPHQALEVAARTGRYEAEEWRVRKDGSRFFANVVISALREASGRLAGFAAITRDVTERRQQQMALDQAQAALAQSQKMEALGQLTGGIAHDFNNLLHVIKNAIAIIERRMRSEDPELLKYLDMVRRNAQRAAGVTQRLLAFSRQQPLNPKPIDPNKLVYGMSDLLRSSIAEGIEIETVLGSGVWPVSVDTNQLETAILNLAVNARDAMGQSGKLTIETANAFLDESYAAAHAEVKPGQYVMIAVSDTGCGMTPEVVARAFDPFFTTKEAGHGTGLGLSQVFGFIKQSGGHVKIYSEVGEGTAFKLYLPRLAGDAFDQPREVAAVVDTSGGETILLVEDDDDVRAFTADVLRELGYRVEVASDARRALDVLEARRDVRLLFTDVGLPNGMNGRQLADEARRRRPALKVLFATGYTRNAIVHHGRLDPDVELLVKPFTKSSLAAKVRRMLDEGAIAS